MPITSNTSKEQIIHDFVHSDDPKFNGKSKKERIKMAMGAYYGLHKEEKEMTSQVKEHIEEFLSNLSNKQFDQAEQAFNSALMDKLSSRLEDMKVDIAQQYFNFESKSIDEAEFSFSAAREGHDIGKPGKNFSKIAKSAGEEYHSKEAGKRVAGAILAKIRAKHGIKEETDDNISKDFNFFDEINEAKNTARSSFDAAHAADLMMNAKHFVPNHFDYGVRVAQKRKDKGTLDQDKLNVAGTHLSKLGAWRFNEKHPSMPQNAEEHRMVGKHLARKINDELK